MKKRTIIYLSLLAGLLLVACKDTDDATGTGGPEAATGSEIRVGGISAQGLVASASLTRDGEGSGSTGTVETYDDEKVTKIDGEKVPWLVGPLKKGLDITYGKSDERTNTSRVAFLQLLSDANGAIQYSDENLAEYSFKYRDNTSGNVLDETAHWYGNGQHFFEGLYVPEKIKYNVSTETPQTIAVVPADLTTDQHDDNNAESSLGNYTLLSHYLAMPPNTTINATVARIKLPFRHRLARVLAYILIDPSMGGSVTINGYKKDANGAATADEDPSTTDIRFCNVAVLAGVEESTNGSHHTYTPQWKTVRKAVPHFVGERGSYDDSKNEDKNPEHFIAYYNTTKKTYIYPTDTEWATVNAMTFGDDGKTSDGPYERTIYGKVPVYDLIVRPTYTTTGRVMYDEQGLYNNDGSINTTVRQNLYVNTNQIDFDLTLSNGLHYTKKFLFDLDANYQTVVYLHISRERVDYNSSGSDLWIETRADDDWYGVNNQNSNNLSIAGSSWQRAYTYGSTGSGHPNTFGDKVTDGHLYTADVEDPYAQYVDGATWIEMLREAHAGGKHHGDYFILHKDITIPAAAFPADFVFTGHLDGQDHTITITGGTYTPAYDSYETYDNAAYTKYVKTRENSYAEFVPAAGETYYQNTTGESGSVYTEITDMNTYAGATAYTKSESYPLVGLEVIMNPSTETQYYLQDGTPIADISDYISTKVRTIYTQSENDVYTQVSNAANLADGTIYYDASHNCINTDLSTYFGICTKVTTYAPIHFYKLYHHPGVSGSEAGTGKSYLFAGLNGCYTTAQESNTSAVWEANVHQENGTWVPYKTDTDGWRAEVINLKVTGGTLLNTGASVTGYVNNCWENGTKITDHLPSIPEYK